MDSTEVLEADAPEFRTLSTGAVQTPTTAPPFPTGASGDDGIGLTVA